MDQGTLLPLLLLPLLTLTIGLLALFIGRGRNEQPIARVLAGGSSTQGSSKVEITKQIWHTPLPTAVVPHAIANPRNQPVDTYYLFLPHCRSSQLLTLDPLLTTVAKLKQTISHTSGIPLPLIALYWQGKNLDYWLYTSCSLRDIGLTANDTIRLHLAVKGGMQPITRNRKRTFLIDDSDGEDDNPPSSTSPQQNAYVDDGSVGDVSDSESDDSDNTSLTNPVIAKPSDNNWQPRCIKRRPIMSKLTTHVYLSNDTIRVATLNLNGALFRTDYDHTPLCDYILRNHIDIIMLIDHRASDSKMNNHIRRIRERCAKDIEYASVGANANRWKKYSF